MIERVDIENFRAIRSLSLRLSPLTALVGPNASGKSTLLEALNAGRSWGGWDYRNQDSKQRVRIKFAFETGRVLDQWMSETQSSLPSPGFEAQVARFELHKLRAPNQAQSATRLQVDGYQLTNVFASLTRKEQDEAVRRFCDLVPVFSDVSAPPSSSHLGSLRLSFRDRWSPTMWLEPERVSDGSILTFAYVVLAAQRVPPDVLLIEEPERGVHPYLLSHLVDLFRSLADGRMGSKRVQVVLATHSAELLEHLRPDEVRFLRRASDSGDVTVDEADTGDPAWRESYDVYQRSLGSLWLSGSLGGVPGA